MGINVGQIAIFPRIGRPGNCDASFNVDSQCATYLRPGPPNMSVKATLEQLVFFQTPNSQYLWFCSDQMWPDPNFGPNFVQTAIWHKKNGWKSVLYHLFEHHRTCIVHRTLLITIQFTAQVTITFCTSLLLATMSHGYKNRLPMN